MNNVGRYIKNAKEILNKAEKEGDYYSDIKYVRSAFGCLYLGILEVIDEFLLSKGVEKKDLPKKKDEYLKFLKKYCSAYNGKLMKEFDNLYDEIHIAGYYRGLLKSVKVVNSVFDEGEKFIRKILRLI
jgi:hypothetical protein